MRREHAVIAHQVHPRLRYQREARRRHRRAAHLAAQAFELRTLARLNLQARVQREHLLARSRAKQPRMKKLQEDLRVKLQAAATPK